VVEVAGVLTIFVSVHVVVIVVTPPTHCQLLLQLQQLERWKLRARYAFLSLQY
jgi:hypothetical protein